MAAVRQGIADVGRGGPVGLANACGGKRRDANVRRCQDVVTGFGSEGSRRVHELVQVFYPVLPLAFGPVVGDQTRQLDDDFDRFIERQLPDLASHPVDKRDEALEAANRRARQLRYGRDQPDAVAPRAVLQLLDGARTDAACREVDHSKKRRIVGRVLDQPQVGDSVLDFGAFEEPQSAVDLVRNTGREHRMLDHARLRIRAVEDGDFGPSRALADQAANLLEQPLRFLAVGHRLVDANRLALAGIGPELLAEPPDVLPDQRVRGIENVGVGAIVLLQLDDAIVSELALERGHVGDVRAAKRVDRLVIVTDGE